MHDTGTCQTVALRTAMACMGVSMRVSVGGMRAAGCFARTGAVPRPLQSLRPRENSFFSVRSQIDLHERKPAVRMQHNHVACVGLQIQALKSAGGPDCLLL
jgi:hypothetical protein